MSRPCSIAAAAAAATLALLASGSAFAQSKTWNFGDQTAPGSCSQTSAGATTNGSGTNTATNIGNLYSCSQQPNGTNANLEVTAWSVTAGASFTSAAVTYWGTGSGVGVGNRSENGTSVSSSPDHSLDSFNNGSDLLMLKFLSGPEALSQVTLGWSGADGDFQVLRWKGSSAPAALSGYTVASALSSGWELVSTVSGAANISTPDVDYGVNSGKLTSSYWLISAYNSGFGGSSVVTDTNADAIKVLAVGTAAAVPEPVSLALVATALGGAAIGRRRGLRRSA